MHQTELFLIRTSTRAIIIGLVFSVLYNLPILVYKTHNINDVDIFPEFMVIFVCSTLFFFLLLLIKYVYQILIPLIFFIGGVSNYYIINFNKSFDTGVLIDLFSVDIDLSQEYITLSLIVWGIFSALLGWVVCTKPEKNFFPSILQVTVRWFRFMLFVIALLTICSIRILHRSGKEVKNIFQYYLPFNLLVNAYYFNTSYLPHIKIAYDKKDITRLHSLALENKPKSPLIVMLIIGESMRGDLISLNGGSYNNMPLTANRTNIISFPHVTSSATSTRVALPYMLTRALPANFEQALTESSIISVFKHLGFTTSWIGAQGAFGAWETTYASNIMEADSHLIYSDLKKILGRTRIYDEDLLQFLDKRLKAVSGDHFIIVHLMGSHWNFNHRYPKSFERFIPVCAESNPGNCSSEQLLNSYNNSILYSDYVIDQIISRLEKLNSFMIYSSDHGMSLGEGGVIGNAAQGDNIPPEQTDIAFFSFASSKFLENYQHSYQKMYDKKSLHISHDYIFHSLLDCINVRSDIIDKNLSLCK